MRVVEAFCKMLEQSGGAPVAVRGGRAQ